MAKNTLVRILTLAFLSIAVLINPIVVKAQLSYPNFPNCLNPNGTIKVSYLEGVHGVPGSSSSYTGKDTVYTNTDGNNTQCLCTSNGDGIQTNWWKTGSITDDEINTLKADSWIFVPDGSLWGLEKASYMAKNANFSCSTNNNSGKSDSSTEVGGGEVLGISTRFGQVLGLATTGTLPVIAGYILSGTTLIFLARKLTK